jgi:hypothetical protein
VGNKEFSSDDESSEDDRIPYQLVLKFSYSTKDIARMFSSVPDLIKKEILGKGKKTNLMVDEMANLTSLI